MGATLFKKEKCEVYPYYVIDVIYFLCEVLDTEYDGFSVAV